jgi:hypothetical protein
LRSRFQKLASAIGGKGIGHEYIDFQFLKFDPKPNGVLLMTINRPEVMNATNGRLHWELTKI